MGKIGKICTIVKEYNSEGLKTLEGGLASRNMTRIPGTGVFKYPYKERDGKWRTGLDPDAGYIKRIQDETERTLEKERVAALKAKLEEALGVDLGPKSNFWSVVLSTGYDDFTHAQPVKLMDGENLFDLSVAWKELEFSWLRVHPTIASSLQAYMRGEYPAEIQFYVSDNEIENVLIFKKKQLINKAIAALDEMTPSKRKKVGRLIGLPITEDAKEEFVYVQIDNALKQTEFKNGQYKGLSPVEVFNRFVGMKENLLHIKDVVKQAIAHSIYRIRANGKVFEGENEIALDEDALVKYLIDDDHQEDLMILEKKLSSKILASV